MYYYGYENGNDSDSPNRENFTYLTIFLDTLFVGLCLLIKYHTSTYPFC